MTTENHTHEDLLALIESLRLSLEAAEDTLRAIGNGEVDAFVVAGLERDQLFTLNGADQPYRILVETMNEGAATLGVDGTIQYCNNRLATMLQIPLENLIGTRLDSYVRLSDQPLITALLEKSVGESVTEEVSMIVGTSNFLPALISCSSGHNIGSQWISVVVTDLTQQKRNEEMAIAEAIKNRKREDALEYAENIVETISQPLLVLSSELKILSANNTFYKTFNVLPDETIGNLIYDLGNRQWDIPSLRALLEEILPNKSAFSDYEVEHNFPGIGRKNILLNAREIFRKSIGSHIILLALEDITERKQAEAELKESNIRFDQLAEQSGTVVWEVNAHGLYTYISHVSEAIMGYLPNEIVGCTHFYDLHPESGREAFKEAARAVFKRKGQFSNFENRVQAKDGHIVWVSTNGIPILDDAGTLLGYRGSDTDITAQKLAEVEMRKLTQAVMQSPISIVITDTHGVIEFINPKFTEHTGYSFEEAVGQNPRIMKSGKTLPETYNNLWSAITAGKTWEGEFCNKKKDGSLFYEHATISALRDDNGTITHYLAVKEDITEKKSVMAQLIHSQKMETIGQLAGGLAHDLNNILCVVNGYTALAQYEIDEDHKVFNYLSEITRASSRAASLTHSLLAYSRKQEMIQQRQNLNLLIETVGSFINRIIRDNITFTLSLQADPLSVNVDTVQMEQVLLNLASNARDAMPDGGVFNIATSTGCIDAQFIASHGYGELGRYAIITTTDTGTGMDAKTMLKVFDPFFTTKEVGKGTGLGLAMVMGIIKQHGGFIDLQSEPGKGSVFQLFLPLVDSEEIAAEPEEQVYQRENVSGTILVAEDDADTRSALEEFLTRAGYTVITAIDGQDAVEKFAARKDEIELVISDVVMPRKSGKAAYDEIRKMSESVKFIFVSGHSSDVILREGEFGADVEIIAKPIMPFELLRQIREIIPHSY